MARRPECPHPTIENSTERLEGRIAVAAETAEWARVVMDWMLAIT